MVISGVAILSLCMLIGIFFGDILGMFLGIDANIGGVGIAMVLLVLLVDYLTKRERLSMPAQNGIEFWSAMYIPIVVAMAANQNVAGALDGGFLAILVGIGATILGWIFVPILSKKSATDSTETNL